MHSGTESYYFSHELHMNLYSLTTLFLLPAFLYAGPSCPAGFSMLNQNKCIKVYTSSAKRSDATTQCTSLGGTLVTIKNAIDNRAISTIAASAGLQNIWIGIYCYNFHNVTCYHDDSTGVISYNSFRPGYPKEAYDIGQSVYMQTNGAEWHTGYRDQMSLPFLCELPTTVADPNCTHNYNGYCYLPSHEIPGIDSSTTYSKAQAICNANSANLASIHSKQEVDYIKSIYTNPNEISQITLGAEASQLHVFNWVDGSYFDYNYFDPLVNSTGNCLQMDLSYRYDRGLWSEISCQSVNNFLCKRKIGATKQIKELSQHTNHFDLSDPSNCNTTLLMAPGVFTSFGYGTSPLPNTYCYWRLASVGAYKVGIYFTDFSVWFNMNIEDQYGETIARSTGNLQPFSVLASTTIATVTHLQTDDTPSYNRHGFRAVVLPY
ncbi:hypothetical protein GCK72_020433 [Caenorhabditis remanei]|uniref:C-type lectin domain-containing protein n=1 Tax=Caenorhabditis remanei TaxID=31234 RepID=A0A6A5GGN8_CAERE|nr:hypothetical protein GCK72_020433 [Caenorhabditis remanei]KAF1753876.1 hypothetical protein GCK72_020433 [Caenorhabditis remanei]